MGCLVTFLLDYIAHFTTPQRKCTSILYRYAQPNRKYFCYKY